MTAPRSMFVGGSYADDVYYSQGYGEIIDAILEYVPELRWPQAGETLNRMRYDSQLSAGLRAYTSPIEGAFWSVDGEGCRPEVVAQVAEDLGLPILGQPVTHTGARRRGVKFDQHLHMSLLDLVFGHMPFEQKWDVSTDRARLVSIQERMPRTIERIYVDGDGQIDYVEQRRVFNQAEAPKIKAPALIWYVNEREGVQWRGKSLLRSAYPYWLIKDQMLRVHATSNRRFGMGTPVVNAPQGATPQQIAEAGRIASNWRGGELAGLGLPAGFTAHLEGMTGSVPDTLAFIKYLDQQMAVALHTQLLNLGTTETGARAVGDVHLDLLTQSQQAIANSRAGMATEQIVVPLVDANWGEDEPAPRIVCGDVAAERELTATGIQQLMSVGALTADPALEASLRSKYKLPARTTPWVDPKAAPVMADPTETVPPKAQPKTSPIAASAGFTGAFIMAMVHPDDAARIAVPGGDDPKDMHVTLGFLAEPAADYDQPTIDRLDQALAAVYPGAIGADAFAIATFNADNKPTDERPPCTVLLVQSKALASLHDAVSDVIDAVTGVESANTFPIWTPHVTLGYGITPADVPPGRLGTIMFDRLVIGWGDDQHDLTPNA